MKTEQEKRHEDQRKEYELLDLFPDDFDETILTDPFARSMFFAIKQGLSPYTALAETLKSRREILKTFEERMKTAMPTYIIPYASPTEPEVKT